MASQNSSAIPDGFHMDFRWIVWIFLDGFALSNGLNRSHGLTLSNEMAFSSDLTRLHGLTFLNYMALPSSINVFFLLKIFFFPGSFSLSESLALSNSSALSLGGI